MWIGLNTDSPQHAKQRLFCSLLEFPQGAVQGLSDLQECVTVHTKPQNPNLCPSMGTLTLDPQ